MHIERHGEVIPHLIEKGRLLRAGDDRHKSFRTLLLGLSGLMGGVYGAAQSCALEDAGLSQVFDTAVGISTGLPPQLYLVANQSRTVLSIYCEDCTTEHFIDPSKRMSSSFVASVLRGEIGLKALHQQRVLNSRTRIIAGLTDAVTGKGVFIDVKDALPDMIQAVHASIAVPKSVGAPVRVGDRPCLDGMGAFPFPIRKVIEEFDPTDVLILPNGPEPELPLGPRAETRAKVARRRASEYPEAVQAAFGRYEETFAEELTWLRETHPCNYAILWSDTETALDPFEQNPDVLCAAAREAEEHLEGELAQAASLVSV